MKLKRFLTCAVLLIVVYGLVRLFAIFPVSDKEYDSAKKLGETNAYELGVTYGKFSNTMNKVFRTGLTKLGWISPEYAVGESDKTQEDTKKNISDFLHAAWETTDDIDDTFDFDFSKLPKIDPPTDNTGNKTENKPEKKPIVIEETPKPQEPTGKTVDKSLVAVPLIAVIDGDTILVNLNDADEKVRFIGIDTPESVHADASRNNEYGKMASDHTKELLKNTSTVYLQYDVEPTDQYGRQLCYIWLRNDVDTDDMQDVANYMLNAIILRDGYAKDKVFMPNCAYADFFATLCEEARDTKSGLWEYNEFIKLWE